MFTRFDRIHERDRQPDRQMERQKHDGIGHTYAYRVAKIQLTFEKKVFWNSYYTSGKEAHLSQRDHTSICLCSGNVYFCNSLKQSSQRRVASMYIGTLYWISLFSLLIF